MSRKAPTRKRRPRKPSLGGGPRTPNYWNLENPFPPVNVFSEERIEDIHNNAMVVLEEMGIKVLLPEARKIYKQGGSLVDEETAMVRIGREIICETLKTAPPKFKLRAGARARDLEMKLGTLTFLPGTGAPHATDLKRGRRPSSLADYRELVMLTQYFDALHMVNPLVEAQDIPNNLRHYSVIETQLTLSDKFPSAYARGSPQTMDSFEILKNFRGLTDEEFQAEPWCYTIINTNSPRLLDIPMAQGIIDFSSYGQMTVVTPFCMMGAMAPASVAGALTLSHAECLAGLALAQINNPGAPVCYGAFASNVDMKSGAPAFGTPEQFQANLGSGQLARRVGLPWRCAAGSSANINDVQAANETQMSLWSCIMAGSTMLVHSAGWIEGGLTVSFEKLITDMEVIQIISELCSPTPQEEDDLAMRALWEVQPGGHFFGCQHTMDRYQSAFYDPLIADWSNFGTWTEKGKQDASQRALTMWQEIVSNFVPPEIDPDRKAEMEEFIAKRTAEGGAFPVS